MRILGFLLIVLCWTSFSIKVAAQSEDTIAVSGDTDQFIEKMNKYLIITTDIDDDIERFEINTSGLNLDIRPNTSLGHDFTLSYRYFLLGLGFKYRFIDRNDDHDRKGKTKSFKYDLSLKIGEIDQVFRYSFKRGFYLNNTDEFINGWKPGEDPYILFPDLVYRSFEGITSYTFNPRFSQGAVSAENERQLQSSGSFIAQLDYRYYIINDKTPLTGLNSSQRSDNFELFASIGYFYTYVFKEYFYATAGFAPYAGIIATRLNTREPGGDIRSHSRSPIYRFTGLVGLGYNSERFFVGSKIILQQTAYNQGNTTAAVFNERIRFEIFLGYRFHAPGFLKRASSWLDRRAPSFLK